MENQEQARKVVGGAGIDRRDFLKGAAVSGAAALAAGALAWQKAIVPPLHVLTEWIVRLLLAPARWGRRYIAVPLRKAACARLAALKKRCCPRRPRKKAGKSKKSGKNQLQKKSKILYN